MELPSGTPFLDLSRVHPAASGSVRDVYSHPYDRTRLLKVLRGEKRRRHDDWPGPLGHLGAYRGVLREQACYLRTAIEAERTGRPNPLAEIGGVVRTDRGLALVVARVPDGRGGLGPTFRALMAGTWDDDLLGALNGFVSAIYALRVNAPDISADNIVLDAVSLRFLLVDGFGDKTLFPLRAWLPWLNRRQVDRRFAALGEAGALSWSPTRRRFTRRPAVPAQ